MEGASGAPSAPRFLLGFPLWGPRSRGLGSQDLRERGEIPNPQGAGCVASLEEQTVGSLN